MEVFFKAILPLIILGAGFYYLRKYLKNRKDGGPHGKSGGGGGKSQPK